MFEVQARAVEATYTLMMRKKNQQWYTANYILKAIQKSIIFDRAYKKFCDNDINSIKHRVRTSYTLETSESEATSLMEYMEFRSFKVVYDLNEANFLQGLFPTN